MCKGKIPLTLALLGALAFGAPKATADTCPDGAVATGLGLVLTAFRTNSTTHTLEAIDFRGVGFCEQIFLQGTLVYVPRNSQGNIVAAFEGGTVTVTTTTYTQDVTPIGGVPKIGPQPSACNPPAVTDTEPTQVAAYTVNPADVVGGKITFFINYRNGTAHIGNDLSSVESAATAIDVPVTGLPACTVAPPTQTICEGASATFTASPTGPAAGAPFTITWSGPNGHTAVCTGLTINDSCAITINNATAADAGTYTATITDAFHCTSTCTGILVVTPAPTCSITGDNPVCDGTTHTYTSTVLPSGGTVTHSWAITGNGTIVGSTTGASVSVTASGAGSFKLTDSITRDGCPGACSLTVTVNPNPTCSITGDTPVCVGTTHTYTSTVDPTGGTVTHSWSISGSGTINGSATGASVSVTATAAGSFTLTDNITREGCPGQCTLTVPVNPNPTCSITGDNPVCANTTHTYISTVDPAGGTVTHSWSISGNGSINGSTTGASVSVTAGPAAGGTSFVLTDNITRDGCPGQCTLTVTVNPCNPRIVVFKQVVCEGAGGCDTFGPNPATDNKSATGAKGANCPAFCYKITVRNTGDVDLNSVTLSDDHLSLASCSFPTTLAVGQEATCTLSAVQICTLGNTVNTVTASGQSVTDSSASGHVTSTDHATVTVVPASVECSIVLHSDFDMDAQAEAGQPDDNHVLLPDSGTVQFALTVHNSGQVDLNVVITGLPCSTDIAGNPIPTTVTVAAGQSAGPFVCDVDVTCPAGLGFNVSVTGTAVASATVPCVFDSQGNAITTTPSTCTASVTCQSPVTCRVTGGGTLEPNTVDQSCIEVDTTIFPLVVNGLTVDHISHGGQLGAPFSHMDCGAILDNPCIRGQWEHVRHYQGKGNPRDVIDMNFHSTTPKGVFDSLSCACLGCCALGDVNQPNGKFLGVAQKFVLCNPDDHKVCGPMPRPAPANAIIFSGVGKFTPGVTDSNASGRGPAEWVVFRVYIEDRSEPGGFHPKGAIEPADVYCFQAWRTGITTARKPDFTTVAPDFRTALGAANCDFLNALSDGSLPVGSLPSPTVNGVTADIQDCGPLFSGNQQIHPSTSATCTQ